MKHENIDYKGRKIYKAICDCGNDKFEYYFYNYEGYIICSKCLKEEYVGE